MVIAAPSVPQETAQPQLAWLRLLFARDPRRPLAPPPITHPRLRLSELEVALVWKKCFSWRTRCCRRRSSTYLTLKRIRPDAVSWSMPSAVAKVLDVLYVEFMRLCVKYADSDEVARAFRDDVARCSDMMSPGSGASLADNFWHSVVGAVNPCNAWTEQAASERAPHSAVASERLAGDEVGAFRERMLVAAVLARRADQSLDALVARERRRLWPVRLIRWALWTRRSRMASA